jgi:hypothetical protein
MNFSGADAVPIFADFKVRAGQAKFVESGIAKVSTKCQS